MDYVFGTLKMGEKMKKKMVEMGFKGKWDKWEKWEKMGVKRGTTVVVRRHGGGMVEKWWVYGGGMVFWLVGWVCVGDERTVGEKGTA
jgi:hypothetical protein